MKPLDLAATLWPELADLRHLDGWFWQRGDGVGGLDRVGLCGYRQVAPSWMDVLCIFAPDDAHGMRSMIDGPVTWACEGTVVDVLTAIASVPRPGQPGAPLTALDAEVSQPR